MATPVPPLDEDEFAPTPTHDRIEDAITRCELDLFLAITTATAAE